MKQRLLPKAKTVEYNQKPLSVCDKFEKFMLFLTSNFLEVSTGVSLKVAKVLLEVKKPWKRNIIEVVILNQKGRSAAKVIYKSLINFKRSYLVQLDIFWK